MNNNNNNAQSSISVNLGNDLKNILAQIDVYSQCT